jgi:transcription antitermination factor NusG
MAELNNIIFGASSATNIRDRQVAQTTENLRQWYAVYTRSRHEKYVREQIERRSIECFLPLYDSASRRKDRRVKIQLPLFPGYVFVRFSLICRLEVLQIPGVVYFVGFGGHATALQDEEIDSLQKGLSRGITAVPHPYLTKGRRVRMKAGPLVGFEGILVRRKGHVRMVLSIDLLQRSIAVDADIADLEVLPEAGVTLAQRYVQFSGH